MERRDREFTASTGDQSAVSGERTVMLEPVSNRKCRVLPPTAISTMTTRPVPAWMNEADLIRAALVCAAAGSEELAVNRKPRTKPDANLVFIVLTSAICSAGRGSVR